MDNGSNIDARLARLLERHEALTASVELVSAQQLANTEAIREMTGASMALSKLVRRHEARLHRLEGGGQ